jgi:hypothetical protein
MGSKCGYVIVVDLHINVAAVYRYSCRLLWMAYEWGVTLQGERERPGEQTKSTELQEHNAVDSHLLLAQPLRLAFRPDLTRGVCPRSIILHERQHAHAILFRVLSIRLVSL